MSGEHPTGETPGAPDAPRMPRAPAMPVIDADGDEVRGIMNRRRVDRRPFRIDFDANDAALLRRLAREMGLSGAAVIRSALREMDLRLRGRI